MSGESTAHIIQSLLVNVAIAAAKGAAAAYTGSGAMLAETIHSSADCGNQILLLLGVRQARQSPDASHPLGYGRALYFWSFMVALLLFTGGGVFSIYEGIHKILEPEPLDNVSVGLGILAFSLALEGYATLSNVREVNQRRKGRPFFAYLRDTKDSDFVVVLGENSAASLGLLFAMLALGAAHVTGDPRWDGGGSVVIGLVLVMVAVFLAIEVKSLIVGESADPEIEEAVRDLVREHESLTALLNIITVQQGPGEVMVALKISVDEKLGSVQVIEAINQLERALKNRCPSVRWCFVEPDLPKSS